MTRPIGHPDSCDCFRCGREQDDRPRMTWRCDTCAAEFDSLARGGPCMCQAAMGELQRRKPDKPL
jgi:hypothetical protein